MRDLTELEKGQIVGARMVGVSVTKATEVLGFSRATKSRTMTECNQTNSGSIFKLTE